MLHIIYYIYSIIIKKIREEISMRKKIILLMPFILLCGCNNQQSSHKISILAPEGTPALGLANYYVNYKDEYEVFDIKNGSDPLLAAFNNKSHDVIIAPTNLGAKMFSINQNYILYETIVWGNLYLTSTEEITSLSELEDKEVTLFSKNSTPDIVLRSLLQENNISNVKLNYVDDVSTANSLLVSGTSKYIVSAQPSLTALKKKHKLYTIDLQEEWAKIASFSSYPQASIFVKKSLKDSINKQLSHIKQSIEKINEDVLLSAQNAKTMPASFAKLNEDVIKEAIPQCHFKIDTNQKAAIEYYFNKINSLGLSQTYGGSLPTDDFYF